MPSCPKIKIQNLYLDVYCISSIHSFTLSFVKNEIEAAKALSTLSETAAQEYVFTAQYKRFNQITWEDMRDIKDELVAGKEYIPT